MLNITLVCVSLSVFNDYPKEVNTEQISQPCLQKGLNAVLNVNKNKFNRFDITETLQRCDISDETEIYYSLF